MRGMGDTSFGPEMLKMLKIFEDLMFHPSSSYCWHPASAGVSRLVVLFHRSGHVEKATTSPLAWGLPEAGG